MFKKRNAKEIAQNNVPDSDSQMFDNGAAAKIAPAIALLLLGESASAQTDEIDGDFSEVPEPSALALFAAGAAAAGTVKYIQNKRRK